MTDKETKMILAILRQNYKNAKIEDPIAELNMWMVNFGSYPFQVIRAAVDLHMSYSEFWPTKASIMKLIPRARILIENEKFNSEPPKALEAPSKRRADIMAIPDGMSEEEFLDSIIQAQIDLETEMYGNDEIAGFLPYEK